MAEKTIHTYSRIDDGIVAGIRLLPMEDLEKIRQEGHAGLNNRIFIGTAGNFPPGSPVQIDISIPEKGVFRLNGVAEWTGGQDSPGSETGIGLRLLEMVDIGKGDAGSTSTDTFTGTGAETPGQEGSEKSEMSDDPGATPKTASPGSVDPSKTVLPDSAAISDLLGSLLDMNVKLDSSTPVKIDQDIPTAICTFILDDGRIKAIWICDLSMVINIGAGLAVIPPEVAMTNINSNELPDNIRENFQEVLNVSASLFNRSDGPHLSLGTLVITPDPISEDIQEALSAVSGRRDLRAIIPDYGEGLMSLIETAAV
ncbi:MAG: hypothetical protein KOO63_07630 [Bacteroidales bacterium]|nr:hypothetical protein [Candidatus Latescibacterota bacterium]